MSYLAQVIATAGEAEVMDLRSKITDTEKKIKSLDKEVEDYLESNYMKFTGLLQENHLILRAKDLATEVNRLENRINNQLKKELDASTDEIKNLSSKLQEVDTCSSIVGRLLNIDSMIRAAEDDQNNGQYLEAAQKFKKLKELLVSDEHIKNLKVYESLSNHVVYLHEKFLSDSLVIWNQFISWTDLDMPDNYKRLILTVNNVDTKADIIRVLLYYDYLDYEVRVLSRKLYDCILEPVIKYNTIVDVKSDDGIWTIILEYKQETAFMNSNVCIQVIDNLWNIFNALLESLDAFITEEETFINKVGDLLEASFCKCIMEYCLYRAIPTKKEELASFEEVAEKVLSFDQFLKDNGFMKPSNTSIVESVKNVNHLFLSKTCQSYLSDARKIFDQDLHDMVQIKSALKDELKSSYDTNDPDVAMCRNVLQQPACFISKSTQDLLELVYKALEEIPKSEVSYGVELYFTVRNIISLYYDLMPLKHKVLLKSIPQQSALFYNNCMYFTHELITLDIKSLSVLPETLHVTFVDFVEPLRSLGHSVLNSQIEIQQEQLLKILENSGNHICDM